MGRGVASPSTISPNPYPNPGSQGNNPGPYGTWFTKYRANAIKNMFFLKNLLVSLVLVGLLS